MFMQYRGERSDVFEKFMATLMQLLSRLGSNGDISIQGRVRHFRRKYNSLVLFTRSNIVVYDESRTSWSTLRLGFSS